MSIAWTIKRSVAATAQPVSLDEARAFLRLNPTETGQDSLISEILIPAAVGYVETFLGRQLITATWRLRMTRFPPPGATILIPVPPTQSVTVTYLDTAGTEQTWAASNYVLNTDAEPAELREAYAISWPSIRDNEYNSVTVTAVAGHGAAASSIPDPYRGHVKRAILGMLATLYAFREDVVTGTIKADIPEGVQRLLQPYQFLFDKPWRT